MAMNEVDPYRFTGRYIKKVISEAIEATTPPPDLPWTTLAKPIKESRVALLSTAGISMRDDKPFDMDGERANPVWGDPSWRRIARDATSADVAVDHLHIDTSYIERDINVALPTTRLAELAAAGIIGESAPHHYAIMGFQGEDSSALENDSAPAIARAMHNDEVDLAILAPV